MSHFEIFILNFNGARFLDDCLSSLKKLDLSGHVVGINLVDNGSHDESREIVNSIGGVNYIALEKNLGFSGGNNAGVEARLKQLSVTPDYVMFLNNDTTVDSQLVKSIDITFKRNSQAGIVGVKSLFMDDYIPISFDFEADFIDIAIEGVNLGTDSRRYRAFKGCHLRENFWRINKGGCLFIPVADLSLKSVIKFSSGGKAKISILKSFYRQNNKFEKELLNKESSELNQELTFEPQCYVKLIQNAGSFVNKRFEAGDLGSFEIDRGQYDEDRELSAVCGVAMAMRTDLFNVLGGFDDHFFAYYEDTDLSLRALRKGYKCYYSGSAMIHHIHAGSSGVATNYFKFNVTYSRLYFLSKFAPRSLFKQRLKEIKYCAAPEFESYLFDGCAESKPNLRARAKYLKYYLKFLVNRIARLFNLHNDRSIQENFFSERYVNEF